MSDNRNWVENQFHTDFTPDQNRALAVVGSLYRLYNLDKYLAGATVQDATEDILSDKDATELDQIEADIKALDSTAIEIEATK